MPYYHCGLSKSYRWKIDYWIANRQWGINCVFRNNIDTENR